MGKSRRTKRKNDLGLRVVDGGLLAAGEAPEESPEPSGEHGVTEDEIAEVRRAMVQLGVPEDSLRLIDDAEDAEDALARLSAAGLVPSAEDSFRALLDGWETLVEPGCDQLTAELCGVEFLTIIRELADDEDALIQILEGMLRQAADSQAPEGLAMARVLARVGPEQVQPVAIGAGERLVASGLQDRPWVRGLGTPTVGRCFGYSDEYGQQEALAVTFRYGKKQHGFAILIDHVLGGGVKDCWVTDRPDEIRAQYQHLSVLNEMHFLEYEPAQARQKLEEALSRPPCPVDADQVEDVRTFLGLLRQRVALLPDPAGDPLDGPTSVPSLGLVGSPAIAPRPASPSRTRASRSPKRGSAQTVHRLKITLRGSKPPIWRRLEFPSVGSLRLLHESIQESFGWDDYHLWVFATPFGDYGLPDRELGYQAAVSKKLMAVAPGVGEKLRYTYDFGDDWVHEILVEDITAAAPGTAYPRCIAGRRACPPEDSGGMRGYGALLEVLANPEHPEHEERREWLGLAPGEVFDPADFDLEGTDRRLSGIATVLVSR